MTLPASSESSLDKQGVRHSSPLTIKSEIDGELVLPEEIEQDVTLYIRVLRPYVREAGHALKVNTPATHPLVQEQTKQE